MYIPKINRIRDQQEILNFIRANSFGILVNMTDQFPVATHIPMELIEDKNGEWLVQCHMAKANLHWKSIEKNNNTLVIFNGPHSYISSSWYDSVSVPTWNYMAVHLYGKSRVMESDLLKELLEKQIDTYELNRANPMKITDYEDGLIDKMMHSIVGIEILIEDVQAKYKLSQNKSENDTNNVIHQLEKSDHPSDNKVAEEMKKLKK